MKNNIFTHLSQSAVYAVMASLMIVSLLLSFFFVVEPTISYGQADTATFTIKQTITDETSFLVNPSNVVASGTINGVTGGTATGTTDFSVISNNANGYRVDIAFADADADGTIMRGNISLGDEIHDYGGDTGGQPSYNYSASTSAQFAYTVSSVTTLDTDQSFLSNGTNACNTGSTDAGGLHCWKSPDTSAFTIIDRDSAAPAGATSTLTFNIVVPSGATPVPEAQTYTATATLSLYIN